MCANLRRAAAENLKEDQRIPFASLRELPHLAFWNRMFKLTQKLTVGPWEGMRVGPASGQARAPVLHSRPSPQYPPPSRQLRPEGRRCID